MKIGSIAQLVFIALSAAAVYFFVSGAQHDQRRASCSALCAFSPDYAGRNRTAPDFELPDAQGKKMRLSSLRGMTVYLNFWVSSCEPCMEEMPALADLARAVKDRKDLAVLTVSTDPEMTDALDKLQVVLGAEAPFPILFDPDLKVVGEKYGTHMFPETWVIDPKGVIRARFDGARDWSMSLAVEIGSGLTKPGTCPMEFFRGTPRGPFSGLCDDD